MRCFTLHVTRSLRSFAPVLRRQSRWCECAYWHRQRELMIRSALLNAGYKVSRSHASAGSIKTNAPTSFVYDVMREYIKTTPVRMDKIPDGNPARTLLAKEQT